ASRSGVAAFSVYEGGKYDIYTLEFGSGPAGTASRTAAGTSGALSEAAPNAGTLPPLDRRPSEVQALLQNAALGLPVPTEYPTEDYKPKLSLEGLAQPTVAV